MQEFTVLLQEKPWFFTWDQTYKAQKHLIMVIEHSLVDLYTGTCNECIEVHYLVVASSSSKSNHFVMVVASKAFQAPNVAAKLAKAAVFGIHLMGTDTRNLWYGSEQD